ncbi:unnamed protein product, partial [Allacma fusca]
TMSQASPSLANQGVEPSPDYVFKYWSVRILFTAIYSGRLVHNILGKWFLGMATT